MKDDVLASLWQVATGAVVDPGVLATHLTEEEALSVQLGLLGRWCEQGDALGGWKVGFTSGASRAAAPAGFRPFGFILQSRILPSGSRVDRARIRGAGVESELCFVMAGPVAGADVTAADVRAAVRGVAPAFEINETRLGPDADLALRVADDLSQWGIAVGTVVPVPTSDALDALEVTLTRDGETVQRQAAHGHIDDHFESIASLARLLARFDRGLRAGDHIITGAFTRQRVAAPGRWQGQFGVLGAVDLEFV